MSKSRDLISAATLQNLEIFRMAIRQDLKEELRKELREELIAELAFAQAAFMAEEVKQAPEDEVMGIVTRCHDGRMTKKAAILAIHALRPEWTGSRIAKLLGCHQTTACGAIAGRS